MDSPNSGSLLFLAFCEMPAMDSPSTCGTHGHQLETTAGCHSLRAHRAPPAGCL